MLATDLVVWQMAFGGLTVIVFFVGEEYVLGLIDGASDCLFVE